MNKLANGQLVETKVEKRARRRVLDWWITDCAWGRGREAVPPPLPDIPDPQPDTESESKPRILETTGQSPSSKQMKYGDKDKRFKQNSTGRTGRPPSADGALSRNEVNARYRKRQAKIPCGAMRDKIGVQEQCGKPSWGGGLCEACYKRRQRGTQSVIPRLAPGQDSLQA